MGKRISSTNWFRSSITYTLLNIYLTIIYQELIYIPSKSIMEILGQKHHQYAKLMMASFILWMISKKPRNGYELIRLINKEICYTTVGAGFVYPLLASLTSEGLIKVKAVSQGKRLSKDYTLTEKGKKRLKEFKKQFFRSGLRAEFIREMIG